MMRTIVTRADGSRVTELLVDTGLERVGFGPAEELAELLLAWTIRTRRAGTAMMAVGVARRAIGREPAGSVLKVERASVDCPRQARVLPAYLRGS